jgi:hypothetical protein
MINYDKQEIRETLTTNDIFDLLLEWGGNPQYASIGIIADTIDHNLPGEGSRKLYFYENSGLFISYTAGTDAFDIFELAIKVYNIQKNQIIDLNEAIRLIAFRFGITGTYVIDEEQNQLGDWDIFAKYDRINQIEIKRYDVRLDSYDKSILNSFDYNIKITPWLNEGMTQHILTRNKIGYYPGGNQISIPHFDKDGRLVGVRGRTLSIEDAEMFGKYRPIFINGRMYNHPLGMNLYNLNNAKRGIGIIKKAIIFESEKSTLLYQSYFGEENDISVACCGSNISGYQMNLLLDAGAEEIIIALDRQFQEIGDDEFQKLKKNLLKLNSKYNNYVKISFIFDKNMITNYKAAPIDEGQNKFLRLFKERILL